MADETKQVATPKKAAKKVAKKETKKAPAKKAAAAKSEGKGAGRTSQFAGRKIHKLVKENPRREGTVGHKSFGLITSGMSYEKYIEAGGRRQDLAFDIAHKYVELRG